MCHVFGDERWAHICLLTQTQSTVSIDYDVITFVQGLTSYTGSRNISWSRWLLLMPLSSRCLDTVLLSPAPDVEDSTCETGTHRTVDTHGTAVWTITAAFFFPLPEFHVLTVEAEAAELPASEWRWKEERKNNRGSTVCSLFVHVVPVFLAFYRVLTFLLIHLYLFFNPKQTGNRWK